MAVEVVQLTNDMIDDVLALERRYQPAFDWLLNQLDDGQVWFVAMENGVIYGYLGTGLVEGESTMEGTPLRINSDIAHLVSGTDADGDPLLTDAGHLVLGRLVREAFRFWFGRGVTRARYQATDKMHNRLKQIFDDGRLRLRVTMTSEVSSPSGKFYTVTLSYQRPN